MNKPKIDRDTLFLKLFFKSSQEVTAEEVEYYREHPEQIEEVTAPVNIHKMFLWGGALLGVLLVVLSKFFKYSQMLAFRSAWMNEFIVDIVYESGIAFIGAAITTYMMGVLLNRQQANATKWRKEIRKKIKE
ncbi:MAG: hypothetical protein RR479_08185 [Acinetobacter sp.]